MDQHHTPSQALTKVLVVGAGAVGCFYGAKLAQAGAHVATTHRSDYAEVAAHGVAFDSIDGPFHFTPDLVLQSAADYPGFPDYLIVTLKVLPELEIPPLIRPAVGPNTTLVLLQNGIQIEQTMAAAFPENEILSALAFICVHRTTPGHVRHLCFGRLVIGRYPSGASDAAERLTGLFKQAGISCHLSQNIITDRWQKLVWNAPFNPISVLTRTTTDAIMACPESRELARQVMEEVMAIATAEGHPLPANTPTKSLEATLRMEPYKTSMLCDFEAGRRLEREAILGNTLKIAQQHGLETPRLAALNALLKLLEPNHQTHQEALQK